MVKHIQDVMKQLSAKQQDVTDLLTPKKPLEVYKTKTGQASWA